ncbi:efflux RND transporter periplasmic adaptor subunit [Chitinophaga japonensis]|uniref:RND family efflux transporter MFP subunit n=1 Tax=Chitinophaga japonensis TaxID=104662 RepID=A0A562T7Y2_CHIJA|nr:efflux RND transporter periplasmic adaptor subunit [Chitinophaga japonensis]TWI89086.1 RND family efflux transporter MFP subunit [Chitinophaga japonensis]
MQLHTAIFAAALLLAACKRQEQAYTVQTKMLNEAVYASGSLMPAEYYFLGANDYDRVLRVNVEDGDSVQAGAVLAVLGTPGQRTLLQLSSRQAALARQHAGSASPALKELETQIALSRQEYKKDSVNAQRYLDLLPERAVSVRDAEEARLQMEASQARYLELQQQYDSRRNSLLREALQADQEAARQRQTQEGRTLESPMDGKVYKSYYKQGDAVQPGQPLFLVGSPASFRLELLVDERDMAKIQLGQEVDFQTDMYGETVFAARINKIDPVLQPETRSFKVEAEVLSSKPFLPQSSVEANIVIRRKQPVLMVPQDYLLPGDTVLLQKDKGPQRIKVQRGISSGNEIEIKQGLREGDIVIKPEQS